MTSKPLRSALLSTAPAIAAAFVFTAASAGAQVVFSETFSTDGPINGASVQTGTGVWNSNLTVTGGALQIASNGYLNINVSALPAVVSTLSFDLVNVTSNNGDVVMVSLGGERETAPDWGQIGNDSNTNQFFAWTKADFAEAGRNGWGNFTAFGGYPDIRGTTATFTLTIDRSVATPTVALSVNNIPVGVPLSFSSQSLFTVGDAISFAFPADVTGGFIDNISLSTAAIPEPASFSVLAGLAALAVGARRRRR